MVGYVKFETPKELVPKIFEMLSVAKDSGRVRKGINEATKSIERKTAQLVVLAEDVTPEEIVIHIPMLCNEKGITYAYAPTKKELGNAVGIAVGTSCVAVENAGAAIETLQDIIKKLPKLEVTTHTPTSVPVTHQKPIHEKPAEEKKKEEKVAKPKTTKKLKAEKTEEKKV